VDPLGREAGLERGEELAATERSGRDLSEIRPKADPTNDSDLLLERREPSKPLVIAILGPTATGKSTLALALAERFDGEIVNCDSTAVYRGFDIGTDKVPAAEQRGIPHHLIAVADPTEEYTAARYGLEASAAVRSILARGRLPFIVGGTGFYYRALTRGLFPGPGADNVLRERLGRIAARRGPRFLHRMLSRRDPESADRIAAADIKRVIRALEVYLLTGRPLTAHFADTRAPLVFCEVLPLALRIPPALRPTVMTTMMIVFALAQPLALFGVGPLLDAFGTQPVLVAFAVAQTLAMAAIALSALAARGDAPAPRLAEAQ